MRKFGNRARHPARVLKQTRMTVMAQEEGDVAGDVPTAFDTRRVGEQRGMHAQVSSPRWRKR